MASLVNTHPYAYMYVYIYTHVHVHTCRRERGQQEEARAAGGRGEEVVSVGGMEEFLHWQLKLATELNWITSAIVAWKVETIEKAFDVHVHQQVEDLQCPHPHGVTCRSHGTARRSVLSSSSSAHAHISLYSGLYPILCRLPHTHA